MSKLDHYVNKAPFDPHRAVVLTPEQERYYMASQWRLMWWKLKRHRLGLASGIILVLVYFSLLISEFLNPYNPSHRHTDYLYMPPQSVHLFHEGEFIGPFVYGITVDRDLTRMQWVYGEDKTDIQPIRFFCSAGDYAGAEYEFWGLIPGDTHLFCPAEGGQLFLAGTDRLGRDMLSRMGYGGRISLTVGLVGVIISFALGIFFGGIAGYYGGFVDGFIQRMIEIIRSFPHLPLWMALSAALPVTWSPIWVFFGLTVILGMLDWPGLARAVRSKLLSLREEDFAVAAELMGARPKRIIMRHLMPSFMSHLIASASLSVPAMILGETALSFLGLGLRPPVVSWGVMMNEAQNINVVDLYPWLILPMFSVILVVLAFNFLGDGLRDAADPYK
ncbi:ABC transporter permease [Aestuariispira insulae]|uniref:Peptide/nickel transport system permease protein n=1 Tax=Aestuariispira insulae TaxID=1461337 RepID=A0A3D9HPB3_9PROT|nr:ABC transporter permease [Aestuariispira insulae]RED51338.1 peptide/nickel transport system permease protein [Aestuariispira insulae]